MTTAPRLTAIAAVGANGVIGDGRGMLWHLPEDFARFKRVTMGGVLVMGRRTYESLAGALKGRVSIVVTRDPAWRPRRTGQAEVHAVTSLEQVGALLAERAGLTWWSSGGGQIYRLLWPYTTDLDITEVHASPQAEVTFPAIEPAEWRQTGRDPHDQFDFVTYQRTTPAAQAALRALIGHAV